MCFFLLVVRFFPCLPLNAWDWDILQIAWASLQTTHDQTGIDRYDKRMDTCITTQIEIYSNYYYYMSSVLLLRQTHLHIWKMYTITSEWG